jgi:predicted aconitase with swiveling domain
LSSRNGISVFRATGSVVEGEALVSVEGFSPRYDLDRLIGEISRPGPAIAGENIAGKVLFFPTAKGGIAAGWAFYDLASKTIAPKAIVFGKINPVMVQGAVFTGITITEGWSEDPTETFHTGDTVGVDPHRKTLELLKRT